MFGEFAFEVLGATKGENPTNPDYLENMYCVATVPVSHAGTVTRSVAVLSISQESHNLIEYLHPHRNDVSPANGVRNPSKILVGPMHELLPNV